MDSTDINRVLDSSGLGIVWGAVWFSMRRSGECRPGGGGDQERAAHYEVVVHEGLFGQQNRDQQGQPK